jgi:hypothetical protein
MVPLPVIMELDGLATSDSPQLAEASKVALSFVSSNLKTFSTSLKMYIDSYLNNLKVQRSRPLCRKPHTVEIFYDEWKHTYYYTYPMYWDVVQYVATWAMVTAVI